MATFDDVESYLDRLGLPWEAVDEGLWVLQEDGGQIVVRLDDPIIVFRAKLMDAPDVGREALYRKLLELNASEMITAAYGLEEGVIVAVASLQSENLDYNEFQGAIDALTMALTQHRIDIAAAAK